MSTKTELNPNELLEDFADPPDDCRPLMRWWWFGPDLDRNEIVTQLTAMSEAGIGGVEVAFVYPLAPVRHAFLSSEFLADLRFAATTAAALGLRFDLTLGSGWPFGGPYVTPELAAKRLTWDSYEIGMSATELTLTPRRPGESLIAAYLGEGSQQEPPRHFRRIYPDGDTLRIGPGGAPRLAVVAWATPTGQQVKRAAAGAEGHVLDHYSAAAVLEHLRVVAEPLVAAAGAQRIGTVFCDSFEAYGSDWTPALPGEFAARWSSDMLESLWLLRFDSESARDFRAKYVELLAELFEQNCLQVIHDWARSCGVPFRAQNYGVPPSRLSGYKWTDVIEGEGWGWGGIPPTRWAASAAHHLGHNVVSSEIWTWSHSPSLCATPLDLKGEAHEHFLLGVNQLVGHGWPASPAQAPGVGRLFYAAAALDDRNAWWFAMPALTDYLSRLSFITRQGTPVIDVTLYAPSRDAYCVLGKAQDKDLDALRGIRAHIGDAIPRAIRDSGLNFDLVDDSLLPDLDPLAIAARGPIVLPRVRRVPESTITWLRAFVAAGGSLLDVEPPGAPAVARAGGQAVSTAGLSAQLQRRVAPDLRLRTTADTRSPHGPQLSEVGFVHRRREGTDLYVVANTGPHQQQVSASPRAPGHSWQRWDPTTGAIADAGSCAEGIRFALAPYEAAIILVGDRLPVWDRPRRTPCAQAFTAQLEGATIGEGWRVTFPDAAPERVSLPHDWTIQRPAFAGTATYECDFDTANTWGNQAPERVELDFGQAVTVETNSGAAEGIREASYRAKVAAPVRDAARVVVNGDDCGVVFAPPFRLDITRAVRRGANSIRVIVGNSTAAVFSNAVVRRTLESMVRASRSRYGARFQMQDLDTAADGLRSGLLATPTLRWTSASPAHPLPQLGTRDQPHDDEREYIR